MSHVSILQTERSSESRLNRRRKMDLDTSGVGYYFGYLVPKMVFGTIFGIWSSFWRSGTVSGIFGAIFGVQVKKFRHVSKGAIKLKDGIVLESDLQLVIGLKIGWLLIWLVNKQT